MPDKKEANSNENVKAEMASGEYYADARRWYAEMFFAPIAQSNLFMITAVLACFAALVSLVSCMAILPINERVTVPVSTPDIDNVSAQSVPLNQKGKTADQTILEFFVKEYVLRRESYSFHSYDKNRAFVKAHSDPISFANYDKIYNNQNTKSPAAVLGERGERVIVILGASINRSVEPAVASVNYEVTFLGKRQLPKSYWTASFAFYYDALEIEEVIDPETGALRLRTSDPVFNVVKYVSSKSNPPAANVAR